MATEFGAELETDVPLSRFTTLRLGGPARAMLTCRSTDTLVAVVRALDASGTPVLILGGGSNLLIADEGVDAVVVRVANAATRLGADHVYAEAGAVWDDVVAEAVGAGLGGLECLSGIPGSAGATPVQNVGAYGVEVGSLLRRVQLLDRATGEVRWVSPDELGLGYRTSVLKHSDAALVLAVEFAARPDGLSEPLRYRELATALGADEGERRPATKVREVVLGLRAGKGMVLDVADHDTWSAGSFFTNPVVPADRLAPVLAAIEARVGDGVRIPQFPGDGGTKLSAGWLIERAGYGKGYPGGDAAARLSTKHTLALTNRGGASTQDLLALARDVRDGVQDAFGVRLEPEPVAVGCTV
ncbi:UDP-N-acetylmuramate dehydrogenase [Rhodococcus tukisamuensis]|uniref:UDP-N-acetylenolpyruvoylglucosamine reductase n=1 Tax=Rhodococcus tukisamuensis TaxID=168276 RepID=A0A1G6W3K7_9NOCA|nr:UDP-N-acetylmuramate dehydrogenase [Rhodococcus tukisamuensis]SDD60421.1 UDP-N-acetylmuramate dehydrogenase [Rhodococcus tukisamuensis]